MYANVRKSQQKNIFYHDRKAKNINYQVGDHVYYKNFNRTTKLDKKWLPYYIILEKHSPVSFIIKHQLDNTTKKAHAAQLRKTFAPWHEMITKNTNTTPPNKRQS